MFPTPKRTAFFALAFFGVAAFTSCAHRYYYPKPLAPPLLSSAKQVKLSGMMSFNFLNPIGTISVAGSSVNHLGVQASAGTASYKETLTETGVVRHDERQ